LSVPEAPPILPARHLSGGAVFEGIRIDGKPVRRGKDGTITVGPPVAEVTFR